MNKRIPDCQGIRLVKANELGMSSLESVVTMAMLVLFTSVVALVMQFTLRFFTEAEAGELNEFEVSNGVLIDHQQIQNSMDGLVEFLSQPGISLESIAFDPKSVQPNVACPAARPVTHWGLPMREVSLPPGYRLCLWKTTAVESSMAALIDDEVIRCEARHLFVAGFAGATKFQQPSHQASLLSTSPVLLIP